MKKFIQVYTKNCRDVIMNIDYLVSIQIKYDYDKHNYIFTLVNVKDIVGEQHQFVRITDELKEMGVYFKND